MFKIKSTVLFRQNTTYTAFIIPVLLHVSAPSQTVLRPTFNCKSTIRAHRTLWDHKMFTRSATRI